MDADTFVFPELSWAGTDHSLAYAKQSFIQMMTRPEAYSGQEDDDEEEKSDLITIQDNIASISIRGSLVNSDSFMNKYFGLTSYASIQRALIEASNDPAIEGIILDIDSGGGAVSGCADTGDLIALIDTQIKPVYSFTPGYMCSAAYWLGCSARELYVSKSAISGSIGVIATHKEYSKAMKDAGVGVTVVRAGRYKALANSMEPLSDIGKQQLQNQLDAAYEIFIDHVAAHRGADAQTVDTNMAQGREFSGGEAVTVGLADGVRTFDQVFELVQRKVLDNQAASNNNPGNYSQGSFMPKPTRQAMTAAQIALLASGVTPEAAVTGVSLSADVGAAGTPSAADVAAAAAVSGAADAQAAATSTEPAASTTTTAAVAPVASSAQAFLEGQVTSLNMSLAMRATEVTALTTKLAEMEALVKPLAAIAANSVSNMKVAMGSPRVDMTVLAPSVILAEHNSVEPQFKAAFPVGGVAAVSTEAPKDETKPAASTMPLSLVKSARYQPRTN